MKNGACLLITTCFLLSFTSTPVFQELGMENEIQSNPSQGYAPYSVDEFESINATDQSYVTSMDTLSGQMAGCAVFSGTFSNSNLGATSVQSSGSMDILLFGWSSTSGYWHTTVGGQSNDFCWKVKWIDEHVVGVSGYFESSISFGTEHHVSEGSKDGFFAIFNTTSSQWQSSISLGTSGIEEFRSFIPLSNGTFALVASSNGNVTGTGITGAPTCDEYAPIVTICSLLMYVDSDLNPLSISTLHSTGSVVGYDAIEVGTTGKILLVGQFTKTLHYDGGDIGVQGTSYTDIFIARFSQQGTNDLMSAFGGEGVDEARSIINTATGFVVAGATESSQSSQSRVYKPTLGWQAPLGHGGKDILMLQVSSNGLITDGFTFGTNQSDSVGEHSVDENGHIYMSGYIGATIQHPITNATLGVENERSAYVAIVNMSGGIASHLVDLYASSGSVNSDARANTVSLSTSDEIWIGGRLSPGAQANTFFGQEAKGFDKGGYILRIGSDLDVDDRPLRTDNCPETYNPLQLDYDQDSQGDVCDSDDDNDGISDLVDMTCPLSYPFGFVSTSETDHDGDGCADSTEDADDDNDGYSDIDEADSDCPAGYINWEAGNTTIDRDRDGCHDIEEDLDDDGDGFIDVTEDNCASSTSTVFNSSTWVDFDLDGCHDDEDPDVDNDGINNDIDLCDGSSLAWVSSLTSDYDQDGCEDAVEDNDDDNDGILDIADECTPPEQQSILGTSLFPIWSDYDGDGCHDEEDNDDDNDGVDDLQDRCNQGEVGWTATIFTDRDDDGCRDISEDMDDDDDGVKDVKDQCDQDSGLTSSDLNWSSNQVTDHDQDGCQDNGLANNENGEDIDDDNDGKNDQIDECRLSNLLLPNEDLDGDGCKDQEDQDIDGDGKLNNQDTCPTGKSTLEFDEDNDGCDRDEDIDDDNDGYVDADDYCDPNDPGKHLNQWSESLLRPNPLSPNEDYDGDGCADDSPEDQDDDNDGIVDAEDECGPVELSKKDWTSTLSNDFNQNGCNDKEEDDDDDDDGVKDVKDQCDPDSMDSNEEGWIPNAGQDENKDGCIDALGLSQGDLKMLDDEEEETVQNYIIGGAIFSILLVIIIYGLRRNEISNTQTIQNISPEQRIEPIPEEPVNIDDDTPQPDNSIHFILPSCGAGVADVEIVEWFVEVGDTVNQGDKVLNVLTDKGTFGIESDVAGCVTRITGDRGDLLRVGEVCMKLESNNP